ncbi:branched-chain amino acid aminotransferase [Cytobacillus oceanisediminis]|uniref:Branched-chain-amino-acid aminotransferase n=1 Tax=Niallia alba TaxID=2729105 RepID=A0A7Y0PMH6_9BACI|nr:MULTISPECIES: branched-chain amino acid aminotransferase [Bacillaceae]MBQ6446139.1 branched-chain amino acid aminotransferase [Bacillus sp. (in: firmicutes)]MDU1843984.1 branched-chain amino acid aminotransferase [Niallia nealsonii]MBZ9535107.1 branched-chain amino acid aminotransferase [Cytobacillus oceanisediminis]MED3794091.1 branched-chain amino acid aminotransferase [Niallia alba]NMO77810.1 branched-chain amino acid aminotransferase [Niallia alba]
MTEQTITVTLAKEKKPKPDPSTLVFGKVFTDHMFMMDYSVDKGWHDAQILPYQPITLDPASVIFHYGQAVFEGLKAYLTKEGKVLLFRPEKNMERLNKSNDRLCIPEIDEEFALNALKQLINIDKEWIPNGEGTSLYIRPFIISTQPFLGVAASISYKFMIILSPVGSYYKEGVKPVKIFVENEYVRAVAGGTGSAKTAGNYAASLKAQQIATEKGYSQVLWLDGVEKKYIEEVGAMNVFFKINGEVVTPQLNGSILEGVTRSSIMELLQYWNIPVTERKVTIAEIFEAHKKGELEEAFGTGTAAVISPIGEFFWNEEKIVLNNGETGELATKLYDTITNIQNGRQEDPFGWTVEVK